MVGRGRKQLGRSRVRGVGDRKRRQGVRKRGSGKEEEGEKRGEGRGGGVWRENTLATHSKVGAESGICYIVPEAHPSELSKYVQNPGKAHMDAAHHVLRYLRGTYDQAIVYERIDVLG